MVLGEDNIFVGAFKNSFDNTGLLDEKESDVSKEKTSEEQARISSKQKEFREQKARQFDIELLALGMLLLFAELLFIKFRGDL